LKISEGNLIMKGPEETFMGGSGSSDWTPSTPSDSCDQLHFTSIVSSPQPAVVSGLKKGDVLNVKFQTAPQTAVLVEHKGAVAGTLTGVKISNLINCLQNGYAFEAEVTSVVGGKCTVEVKPA
jgi:acetamidase/formamidase